MKASELKPGQFFEFESDDFLCVYTYEAEVVCVDSYAEKYKLAPNDEVFLIDGWDDEPESEDRCQQPDWHAATDAGPNPDYEPPKPAPLQLREGAWYRRRDQKTVGPLKQCRNLGEPWRWTVEGYSYRDDGTQAIENKESEADIIAEVPPPFASPFDAGDRVKCVNRDGTMLNYGSEYTVMDCSTNGIRVDEAPELGWLEYSRFVKVPPSVEPVIVGESRPVPNMAKKGIVMPPVEPTALCGCDDCEKRGECNAFEPETECPIYVEPTELERFKVGDWVVCDLPEYGLKTEPHKVDKVVRDKLWIDGDGYHASRFRRATPAEVEQHRKQGSCQGHATPQPDADGWIVWGGGEWQGTFEGQYDLRFRDGREYFNQAINNVLMWRHSGSDVDIVAYRLVQPAQPVTDGWRL